MKATTFRAAASIDPGGSARILGVKMGEQLDGARLVSLFFTASLQLGSVASPEPASPSRSVDSYATIRWSCGEGFESFDVDVGTGGTWCTLPAGDLEVFGNHATVRTSAGVPLVMSATLVAGCRPPGSSPPTRTVTLADPSVAYVRPAGARRARALSPNAEALTGALLQLRSPDTADVCAFEPGPGWTELFPDCRYVALYNFAAFGSLQWELGL